jgi:hypothetical protein
MGATKKGCRYMAISYRGAKADRVPCGTYPIEQSLANLITRVRCAQQLLNSRDYWSKSTL